MGLLAFVMIRLVIADAGSDARTNAPVPPPSSLFRCTANPFVTPEGTPEPANHAHATAPGNPVAGGTGPTAPLEVPPPLPPFNAMDDPLLGLTPYQQRQVDWILSTWKKDPELDFFNPALREEDRALSFFDPEDVRARNVIFEVGTMETIRRANRRDR
jgi:hypothetical protein